MKSRQADISKARSIIKPMNTVALALMLWGLSFLLQLNPIIHVQTNTTIVKNIIAVMFITPHHVDVVEDSHLTMYYIDANQ